MTQTERERKSEEYRKRIYDTAKHTSILVDFLAGWDACLAAMRNDDPDRASHLELEAALETANHALIAAGIESKSYERLQEKAKECAELRAEVERLRAKLTACSRIACGEPPDALPPGINCIAVEDVDRLRIDADLLRSRLALAEKVVEEARALVNRWPPFLEAERHLSEALRAYDQSTQKVGDDTSEVGEGG